MAHSRKSKSKSKDLKSPQKIRKGSGFPNWFKPNLFSVEEIPEHLRFNTYVLRGYRQLSTWKSCFLSLFYIHNETANILTHLPMAIYTLIRWRQHWPWDEVQSLHRPYLIGLGVCHTIAMIVPWIPSFLYHTFMCHAKGHVFYDRLLTFDVLGIWMTEFFGSLTGISASLWLLSEGTQGAIVGLFNVISFFGLIRAMMARNPSQRVFCFAPLFIGRVLSIILRLSPIGGGNPDVLIHVIMQDVTSIIGGLIGVVQIPEKWSPGRFDYFFNSHNIMHILVIIAVNHMDLAANGDIQWIIAQTRK